VILAPGMWFFLIPVIVLAGATFTGAALEMSNKPAVAVPVGPTSQPTPARTLPVNGATPADPPSRMR
jgi:hypothetical protein